MKPLDQPDTHKVYMLLKQTGTYLVPTTSSTSASNPLGIGFFWNREEAEQHRTMEILKLPETDKSIFHVYELDIPNISKKTR